MSRNRQVKLRNGQGTIIDRNGKFEVLVRRLDIDHNLPLASTVSSGSRVDIVKFLVDFVGVTYIDSGGSVDFSESELEHYKGNSTLLVASTAFGPLFIKKIRQIPICNCAFIDNKYNILAACRGVLKLTNDRNGYRYGMILERCYPPKINFTNFVEAVVNLAYMHKSEPHALHGDVNPSNIMSDQQGVLKLVDPVCILEGQVNIANVDYEELTQQEEMRLFILSLLQILGSQFKVRIDKVKIDYSKCQPEFTISDDSSNPSLADVLSFNVSDAIEWKDRMLSPRAIPEPSFRHDYYKLTELNEQVSDLDDDDDI